VFHSHSGSEVSNSSSVDVGASVGRITQNGLPSRDSKLLVRLERPVMTIQ
jgi:hypothetical protein